MKNIVTFFIFMWVISIIPPVWSGGIGSGAGPGAGPGAGSKLVVPARKRARTAPVTHDSFPPPSKIQKDVQGQSIFKIARKQTAQDAWSDFSSLFESCSDVKSIYFFPYFKDFNDISGAQFFRATATGNLTASMENLKKLLCDMPCSGDEALQVSRLIHISKILASKHCLTSEIPTKLDQLLKKYSDLTVPERINCPDENQEDLLDQSDKLYSILKNKKDLMNSEFNTGCYALIYAVHHTLSHRCCGIHSINYSDDLQEAIEKFSEEFNDEYDSNCKLSVGKLLRHSEKLGLSHGKVVMFLFLLDDLTTKYVTNHVESSVLKEDETSVVFKDTLKSVWETIDKMDDETSRDETQSIMATLAARLMEKNFLEDNGSSASPISSCMATLPSWAPEKAARRPLQGNTPIPKLYWDILNKVKLHASGPDWKSFAQDLNFTPDAISAIDSSISPFDRLRSDGGINRLFDKWYNAGQPGSSMPAFTLENLINALRKRFPKTADEIQQQKLPGSLSQQPWRDIEITPRCFSLVKGGWKEYRLQQEIAAQWREFSQVVSLGSSFIVNTDSYHRGNNGDCCREVLIKWRQKGSEKLGFPTWGVMVNNVLPDMDLTGIAVKLSAVLDEAYKEGDLK